MADRTVTTFRPYVADEASVPEFTLRAILLGCIFGIIFGAVTVYVGLRAGLTVAASIPISVLSISVLRALGKASILENNIVQTTGNAGQSIASGVIFTLPALVFLAPVVALRERPPWWQEWIFRVALRLVPHRKLDLSAMAEKRRRSGEDIRVAGDASLEADIRTAPHFLREFSLRFLATLAVPASSASQ